MTSQKTPQTALKTLTTHIKGTMQKMPDPQSAWCRSPIPTS
jgi:hypothetical protein